MTDNDDNTPGKVIFGEKTVEMIPSLPERPPLGDVIRIVEVPKPRGSHQEELIAKFLLGIENAWRIRAAEDSSLTVFEEKDKLAVVRTKPDDSKELRYIREKGPRATIYADATELANLIALGLVQDVPIVGVNVTPQEDSAKDG